MVQHLDAAHGPLAAILDTRLGMHDVIGGEQRIVDLQHQTGVDDRAVFLAQRLGQRVEVFLLGFVVLVAVPIARLEGDTAGMNASSWRCPSSPALRLAMSRCNASMPL